MQKVKTTGVGIHISNLIELGIEIFWKRYDHRFWSRASADHKRPLVVRLKTLNVAAQRITSLSCRDDFDVHV